MTQMISFARTSEIFMLFEVPLPYSDYSNHALINKTKGSVMKTLKNSFAEFGFLFSCKFRQ